MKYILSSVSLTLILLAFNACISTDEFVGAKSRNSNIQIGSYDKSTSIISTNSEMILVDDKQTLLSAIKLAREGSIIYIKDNTRIDLSGQNNIKLNEGITITSGRTKDKLGALLFTNSLDAFPLFVTNGSNIRISGLRLQGPDTLRRTEQMKTLAEKSKKDYYNIPNSRGIQILHHNIEIDNCEVYGWSHAAIYAKGKVNNIHIHHNYIHHNQRYGLGYGISLDGASALIEFNYFDWNRHAVAGSGRNGTSYEACYNIVGKNANGHAFDMHGSKDRSNFDSNNDAGLKVNIHHNTIQTIGYSGIIIRGVPSEGATITNNKFINLDSSKAIQQINKTGRLKIAKNKYADEREE